MAKKESFDFTVTAPKSRSNFVFGLQEPQPQNLWRSLCAGDGGEFIKNVREMDSYIAGQVIAYNLLREPNPLGLLDRVKPMLISIIPHQGSPSDFLSSFFRQLIKDGAFPTSLRIDLLTALSAYFEVSYLDQLEPMVLEPEMARFIVERFNGDVPKRMKYVYVALHNCDPIMFDALNSYFSDEERFQLLQRVVSMGSKADVHFLLTSGIAPDSFEEKLSILESVICNENEQCSIFELLLGAWFDGTAMFDLGDLVPPQLSRLKVNSFKFLLAAGATIRREGWAEIFSWNNPPHFSDQVDAYFASGSFLGWEVCNNDGQTFLVEVDARLSKTSLALRLPIISKLLDVGADPVPLLKISLKYPLPEEEIALLKSACEARKREKSALKPDTLQHRLHTDLDLL